MKKPKNSIFERNARELRELHAQLRAAFDAQPRSEAHLNAVQALHNNYDRLAMPGGLGAFLIALRNHDRDIVPLSIAYLQADPRYFRSGYLKEEILHRLKHIKLSPSQARDLSQLTIQNMSSSDSRKFQAYARLSGVLNSESVRKAAIERISSNRPEVASRAEKILHVMRSCEFYRRKKRNTHG